MITSPITRPITSRIASAIAGAAAVVGRWYLHWGGVNQYAQHDPWSMSGFGDRIEFSFVADDPGNGTVNIIDSASATQVDFQIADTSAVLYLIYKDTGTTNRTIAGPTIVAGTLYSGYIEFNADGVVLNVNGTSFTNPNVPGVSFLAVTHVAVAETLNGHFPGTIHYLRYVNATALQGVNAVMGNGVDLYGTIPEITLTSATISFPLLYKSGDQTILTGSVAILTVSSDLFVKGANVTSLLVDGQEYASETLVDGQHYDIVVAVDGGTLTTIGLMASGGIMGTLTVEV